MADSVISVYSDARSEYTKQLCLFLVPSYFQFYLNLLDKARETVRQEPKKLLWQYQTLLTAIPEWNNEKVTLEIGELQKACGCDYLDDLLTAVFIAHTKVLTAIRVSAKQKKVQITVPKVEHFLFKVLCECSKLLWGSTYLFREDITSIERQQNYRSIEGLLQEGILQAIRAMVPVKSILKDFVSNEDTDDITEDTETETQPPPEPEREPEPEPQSIRVPETMPNANVNTIEAPQETATVPIIDIEDKPHVHFAPYDIILDQENPEKSDLVETLEEDLNEGPPQSLSETEDFENLDTFQEGPLSTADYEQL
jgi:hypothetical protein